MNKHTPAPWALNTDDIPPTIYAEVNQHCIAILDDSSGAYIFDDVATCEANAAHIVRCVNSHDALVEYYRAAESFAFTSGHEDATVEQERAAEERFERAGDAVRKLMREGLLAAAGAPQ